MRAPACARLCRLGHRAPPRRDPCRPAPTPDRRPWRPPPRAAAGRGKIHPRPAFCRAKGAEFLRVSDRDHGLRNNPRCALQCPPRSPPPVRASVLLARRCPPPSPQPRAGGPAPPRAPHPSPPRTNVTDPALSCRARPAPGCRTDPPWPRSRRGRARPPRPWRRRRPTVCAICAT